jgi:CIC family chloride channel protein
MRHFFQQRIGFFLLALAIGIVVGYSTVVLIEFIRMIERVVLFDSEEFGHWRYLILAPVAGGVMVGALLHYLPGNRIQGIADVMEASALRGGKMDVRSGFVAALATGISLGSGAPLGREGPAVHIGASLTSWVGDIMRLDRTQSLTLLGCAAAAAVTASFNTPIAGVIFALEVIVGYYALRVFAPVVIAAMGAVIVRHNAYGNAPEFSLPDYAIDSLWELPLFALLGLVAAALVQGFIYLVIFFRQAWERSTLPVIVRPALAGLIIGLAAFQYPLILGVGYEGTSQALSQNLPLNLLFILLALKWFCSALALSSGMAGGVFSPSLFIGAMLGGSFWLVFEFVLPSDLSSQGVYSVVGMAAVASAMLGAPISTLLIVFELTLSYDLVIAVMLAAAMASTLMQIMPHGSFFRWQLASRSVNINTGRDQSLLRTSTIDDLVLQSYVTVSASSPISDVERLMVDERCFIAIVCDDNGNFVGSLSTDILVAGAATAGRQADCGAIMHGTEHVVPASTRLSAALEILDQLDSNYAPVTSTVEGDLTVIGIIYRSDVLNSLYSLLRQARSEEETS